MAGFQFSKTKAAHETVDIRFEADHPLHGLEITVRRRVPVGVVIAASEADLGKSLSIFAEQIVGWNVLGADGRPVPPSVDAFGEHVGLDDATEILMAWREAMTQPSAPLGEPLPAGAR